MSQREEYQRTIGYGEAAIGQIRRNETPAYPRNYELWYTYCAGFNHALNKAINDIIRSRGGISAEEVQSIYDQYLAPFRLGDRIDEVGGRISGEINDVVAMVGRTIAANPAFTGRFTYRNRLRNDYPKRSYCLQYRESDLAFITRLLAEEGIS